MYSFPEDNIRSRVMHGTTTVALICRDGVVVGADTRVTSGYFIAHKRGKKIFTITPRITLTIAGIVADAQALIDTLRYNVKLYELRNKTSMNPRSAARLLSYILFRNRMFPLIAEMLVAGVNSDNVFTLYRLDLFGSLTPDDYSATGSGSPIALGVLESEYRKDISVEDGKNLVAKSITAAMKRDIGSGNDFDIVVLNREGTHKLSSEEKESLVKDITDIST